jgi:hypothetical protein
VIAGRARIEAARMLGMAQAPAVSVHHLSAAEKRAYKSGRIGRAIELDPLFVDVIVRRMQTLFGMTAINVAAGQTFEALAEHVGATSPAAPARRDQPGAREAAYV